MRHIANLVSIIRLFASFRVAGGMCSRRRWRDIGVARQQGPDRAVVAPDLPTVVCGRFWGI